LLVLFLFYSLMLARKIKLPRVPPVFRGGAFSTRLRMRSMHAGVSPRLLPGTTECPGNITCKHTASHHQQHRVKAFAALDEMSGVMRPTASGAATLRSLPAGHVALSAPPPLQVGRGRDPLDFSIPGAGLWAQHPSAPRRGYLIAFTECCASPRRIPLRGMSNSAPRKGIGWLA
jgi:hypothetical protein